MKRKIIIIDEELCDGCGECIVGCSEGALQLVDGKAKLVKEDFCDGFGQGQFKGEYRKGKPKIEAFHKYEYPLKIPQAVLPGIPLLLPIGEGILRSLLY